VIRTRASIQGLKKAAKDLRKIEAAFPKAYSLALNESRNYVKSEATRAVRETYLVRAKAVNDKNKITIGRSTPGNLNASLVWKGRNLPLIQFRTNPNKVPDRPPRITRAAVMKTGMKPIKGAFVTRVGRGGHVGVFQRIGRSRLPIRELHGPAVPTMINKEAIMKRLKQVAEKRMDERLEHHLNRIISSGRR